jgi:uncharacterized protein YegP (UPF0339 family)
MIGRKIKATIIDKQLEKPRIHLRYPVVSGLPDKDVERRINHRIQDLIYQMIRDEGYAEDLTKDFTGNYKIRVNQNGVLSLSVEMYSYAEGAAHGLTVVKSLTFDLKTGRVYRLRDLFRLNSNYRAIISDMIKKEIKAKDIPLIAKFMVISEDEDFYLTENALVIYFQLYEYTPYAYGIPEFAIPYRALQRVINPKGPVPKLR